MKKQQTLWHNNHIHLFLAFSFLLLVIVPIINKTPSLQVSEQSKQAAVDFLKLVDNEEYAKSWEVSAASLQKMLPRNVWSEKLAKLRSDLGPVVERTHEEIAYAEANSDMPEGEYVVITFVSRFRFKEYVTERVTLWLDENEQWLVAGYFLR